MRLIPAIFLLLLSASLAAQYSQQRYPVIPKPQTLLALSDNFSFSAKVTIVIEDKSAKKECEFFRAQVKQLYGIDLRYGKLSGFEPCIFISLDSFDLPAEGYEMFITKEGVNLYGSRSGIFYGLQTILQLIQPGTEPGSFIVPACSIIDYPRFPWRGMHLDVARHFFPKENVKDYLRYMAMYKLNTFHWHLTDDQGWRIEIKKYPLLTSVGAWRNATLIGHYSEEPDRYDSTRYGGFYTQEEIKEVVRFADSLHITVVPEIEMPGHATALLAAYPNAGIDAQGKVEVACTWGVFTEVIYPADEGTIGMLRGILDEVCELFPGKYIHIGGDECPKDEWKSSERCQQFIRSNNLKDEHGLQSWFIKQIVTHLGARGKKAIGWDEILEGGLADGAAVMSWRGEEGGIAAAKAHHFVVMTPGSHCYFDHYQSQSITEPLAIGGYLPIEKVYSYDPVPSSLSVEERKYIMGVQANVWTEYIPAFSDVQYMIFPRIAAISEVAWSSTSVKNFESFVPRIMAHMNIFRGMKVNYSRALFEVKPAFAPSPDGNGMLLSFSTYLPYADIRYNSGGLLTLGDSLYRGPILISRSQHIRAGAFLGEEQLSSNFDRDFTGHKAMGKQVTLRKPPSPSYNTGGAMTLVDGNNGRSPWTGSEWLGWWGDTMDVVIDLGKTDTIRHVNTVMLRDEGSWIYSTQDISILFSVDGVTYKPVVYEMTFSPLSGSKIQAECFTTVHARYVRIKAVGKETIEEGKPGAGYPAWLFVSEIIVE